MPLCSCEEKKPRESALMLRGRGAHGWTPWLASSPNMAQSFIVRELRSLTHSFGTHDAVERPCH